MFRIIPISTAIGSGMNVDYDQPDYLNALDPDNACPKALLIATAVVSRLPPATPR